MPAGNPDHFHLVLHGSGTRAVIFELLLAATTCRLSGLPSAWAGGPTRSWHFRYRAHYSAQDLLTSWASWRLAVTLGFESRRWERLAEFREQ